MSMDDGDYPDEATFAVEHRFRAIFRAAHAGHPGCSSDEWLDEPCREALGTGSPRPIVWSRRNGPWRRVSVLWVGAAPGNDGGRGGGTLGAHGTRIPFGGDIAGANLDVLLEAAGLDRNRTFLVGALNALPRAGGGEPSREELAAPVGDYPSSLHLLRDTLLATGPELVIALGTVALRALAAAVTIDAPPIWAKDRTRPHSPSSGPGGGGWNGRLPGVARLRARGLARGEAMHWSRLGEGPAFEARWRSSHGPSPLPRLLWLMHPSGQNMSPYAGRGTAFHRRMAEARAAVVRALPGAGACRRLPRRGIYDLPEWRERIAPRHGELVRLWSEKGI